MLYQDQYQSTIHVSITYAIDEHQDSGTRRKHTTGSTDPIPTTVPIGTRQAARKEHSNKIPSVLYITQIPNNPRSISTTRPYPHDSEPTYLPVLQVVDLRNIVPTLTSLLPSIPPVPLWFGEYARYPLAHL